MNLIISVAGSFLAILAFSILLETPRKYLILAGATGAMGGIVYLVCVKNSIGVVLASFLSALSVAILSHIFARIFKAPVTLFLIAGILPTVPGNGMYQVVSHMIDGAQSISIFYLIQTLQIAGVIALAIFIVDSFFRLLKQLEKSRRAA